VPRPWARHRPLRRTGSDRVEAYAPSGRP